MHKEIRYAAMTMAIALSPLYLHTAQAHGDHSFNADPVVLSFSTVGDSRQALFESKYDVTQEIFTDANGNPVMPKQDTIWHQNTKAISRIVREVEHQRSDLFFFNGDMIMGYGNTNVPPDTSTVDNIASSDLVRTYKEYAFWRGIMAGMLEKGTYVVPVPGNHEVQCNTSKTTEGCTPDHDTTKFKGALVANENAWRANMGDLILDDERMTYMFGHAPSFENVTDDPVSDAADNRTTDQSKLSYSFDFNGSHFAVINTDPVGNDATAPVAWLTKDLADAKARGVQHMFVFGHKPAFSYDFDASGDTHGFDSHPDNRDAFWSLIEQYGATYFCGHEHIYHMTQPTMADGGKAWQVLVGSGGSPFDVAPNTYSVNPATDRDYAWATVLVHRSGAVRINVYGFDDQFGPTKLLQTAVLPQ
jgi:Calcineurin-like phosphoesterase